MENMCSTLIAVVQQKHGRRVEIGKMNKSPQAQQWLLTCGMQFQRAVSAVWRSGTEGSTPAGSRPSSRTGSRPGSRGGSPPPPGSGVVVNSGSGSSLGRGAAGVGRPPVRAGLSRADSASTPDRQRMPPPAPRAPSTVPKVRAACLLYNAEHLYWLCRGAKAALEQLAELMQKKRELQAASAPDRGPRPAPVALFDLMSLDSAPAAPAKEAHPAAAPAAARAGEDALNPISGRHLDPCKGHAPSYPCLGRCRCCHMSSELSIQKRVAAEPDWSSLSWAEDDDDIQEQRCLLVAGARNATDNFHCYVAQHHGSDSSPADPADARTPT